MTLFTGRFSQVVGAVTVGLALCLGTLSAQAADDKKPPTVSAEVAKILKPAQDAAQKGDFDGSFTLAQQALGIAKKPYDIEVSLRIALYAAGKKQDFPTYATLLEQLNTLDSISAEEKAKSYKPLAQIYGQQKNFDKAIGYAAKWTQSGGGVEAYTLLANLYLTQKDYANAVVALEHAVEGRSPAENELKQLNYSYYQLTLAATDDKTKAIYKKKRWDVMETLVARFLARDYVSDLLLIYQEQKLDDRALLNMYRFMYEKDFMTRESEFVDYTDMALNLVGAPAEALQVINRGIQKDLVKLISKTDRNSTMLAQAKQQTAEDKKTIDKEAQTVKTGEAAVKVGLAYLGLGEYQKAVDMIKQGLSPDRIASVKRVDDANMMLGVAYVRLGKADDAKAAFTAAAADARMSHVAKVWLSTL